MVENNGFKLFLDESKEIGASYMNFINELSQKSSLDKLTNELVYISALTAAKTNGGLAFHVQSAKNWGQQENKYGLAVEQVGPLYQESGNPACM
jgi:alkylhydroperoxidase/carboxymuconolactone decarboxylase family protein YurZ